jgi:hypothetical protein
MRKAIPMGFVLLAIGIVAGSQAPALSAELKSEAATKWEYRIVSKEQLLDLGKKDLVAGLNKLGDDGWELVAVEPAYIFKRPKDRKTIEDVKQQLFMAQSNVELWKDRLNWAERMVKKGYMTDRQLQAETARLKDAEFALEKIERELKAFLAEPKPLLDK